MKVAQKPKTCMNELLGDVLNISEESNQRLTNTPSLIDPKAKPRNVKKEPATYTADHSIMKGILSIL